MKWRDVAHSRKKRQEGLSGLLLVAPAFILLLIFVLVPLVMAIVRSFYYYESGPNEAVFAGWDNYIAIFQNDIFLMSLGNICLMTFIIVICQVVGAYLFANVLIRIKNKFGVFMRVIIYLPYLFSGIVIGTIFTLLTYSNGGVINGLLLKAGLDPISFTYDKFWAYVSIIVPTLWAGSGYTTLIFYSGLINIPKEVREAAAIDGSGFFRTAFSIDIPCLRQYFVLVIVTLVTGNLQMFEIPMLMTNGMPLNSTMTPVLYLIHARANGNVPQSQIIASSILIMLIIGAINAVVFVLTNRKDKDERRKKHVK